MIKDSGRRKQMAGMVRDVTDGKIDYSLSLDGPLFERLAKHLTEGAEKYSKRNWLGAHTQEEYDRFRESAIRHFIQYLRGDTDEDHFAAVAFNLNGMEYVAEVLEVQAIADERPIPVVNRRHGLKDRRVRFCRGIARAMGLRREDGEFGRRMSDNTSYTSLPKEDC